MFATLKSPFGTVPSGIAQLYVYLETTALRMRACAHRARAPAALPEMFTVPFCRTD